jgi:hypothetical protein
MPAETHQRCEPIGVEDVAGLLACVIGLDAEQAADVPLADLHLDDDLSILHLWDVVVEEFGERSIGDLDLDLDQTRPCTLGELAELFARELVP